MFIENMKETMNEVNNYSVTENGALGFRTTGKNLLDLNFGVASLRSASDSDIINRFMKAYYDDKMLAIKWLFYARDAREGLGERRLFRVVFRHLANENPSAFTNVIKLISEYGRFDDLWCLLDTTYKKKVISVISQQLNADMENAKANKPISLCAKWMPSLNCSSAVTKEYAKQISTALGMTPKNYRKMLSSLRSYIDVVEVKMSAKKWDGIDYSAVPSRANLIYNDAFLRNDEERRREYLAKLEKGEIKINASVLFPHEIVNKYIEPYGWGTYRTKPYDTTLEQLWKALPNLVNENDSTIVVADGSGSMTTHIGGSTTALNVANALAIYFAEKCKGEFENKYITFSGRPQLVDFSNASSLKEKLDIASRYNECANTNIEAVFDLILNTAKRHKMAQEELPKNILIISDMEFDSCTGSNNSRRGIPARLFDDIAKRYNDAGYTLPRLIFWNVNSRTGTIPVKENKLGVALVSGFSTNIVKMVMSNKTDPYECLLEAINAERYAPIEAAIKDTI